MSLRIRKAIKKLGRFYGVNSTNPYASLRSGAAKPPQQLSALQYIEAITPDPDKDSIIREYMERLTTMSLTVPSVVSMINTGGSQLKGEDGNFAPVPMLITPCESLQLNYETCPVILNGSTDKVTRQGSHKPANGKFYTFDEACGAKIDENAPKISIVQMFAPVDSATSANSDIASTYMNSITTLQASRAVPYLEIFIVTAESTGEQTSSMSLGRFLGIESRSGLSEGSPDYALAEGRPILAARYRSDFQPDENETVKIASGIEIFTTPQTLVNADEAYRTLIPTGKVLDPFQPLMSLEGLKLNVIQAGGLLSERKGEIVFVLHDRARLNEVSALISPNKFGKTRLVITYGYAHPEGNNIAGDDDAIGTLLDSMRVTEVFLISNVTFDFGGQNVKISAKIAPIGSTDLKTLDVVYADTGDDLRSIKSQFEIINRGINAHNNNNPIKKISAPSFLASENNVGGNGLTDEQRKALVELKKAKYLDPSIRNALEELFGNDGKSGKVASAVKRKNDQLDELFARLVSTPDPFLPSANIRELNTTKHVWDGKKAGIKTDKLVSFGKVVSVFVGNSLAKSTNVTFNRNDEIQLCFHPFNQDAAGMQDYNLSQFIIEVEELRRIVKEKFDITGSMPISKFLNILKQFFIGDLGAASYGLLDSRQRSIYKLDSQKGGRVAPERKQSSSKKNKPPAAPAAEAAPATGAAPAASPAPQVQRPLDAEGNSTAEAAPAAAEASAPAPKPAPKSGKRAKVPSYEEVLEENKSKNLGAIYGLPNDAADAKFRPPNFQYNIEACPKSSDWGDDLSKAFGVVLKIHFMDTCTTNVNSVGDLIKSVSESKFIPILYRPTDTNAHPYASAHIKYNALLMNVLAREELIREIDWTNADYAAKANEAKLSESTRKSISSNYIEFVGKPERAKEIVKKMYPTLLYGHETSGILSAKFSTLDDPALSTIMITRASRTEEGVPGNNGDKEGVPIMVMPVSLTMETFGCPYFSFAQFYYVDMGTNTDVDNVYAITSIDHNIQPGKYSTSLKLTQINSFGSFRPLKNEFALTALSAFLTKFSPAPSAQPARNRSGARSTNPNSSNLYSGEGSNRLNQAL